MIKPNTILYFIYLLFVFMFCGTCLALPATEKKCNDVYVVFYATIAGKTGHIGIAVSNYKIVYKEIKQNKQVLWQADTLPTNELTYYDLWPNEDYFTMAKTISNIPAEYFKLPVASTGEGITVASLIDKGIPHKEHYPSDGLLRIATNWQQDQQLLQCLDSMVQANRDFNGQQFNCSDFVRIPLEKLLHTSLTSKEFVLTGFSTTPNKLYRTLRKKTNAEIIKNADKKAFGSFLSQRVLYKIFHHSKQPNSIIEN
jgi:hypothetical protein